MHHSLSQIPWEKPTSFAPPTLPLPLPLPLPLRRPDDTIRCRPHQVVPPNLSCRFKLQEPPVDDLSVSGDPNLVRLPIVVRRRGKAFQYIWDGAHLRLVNLDREPARSCHGLETWALAIRKLFVPQHVQGHYMGYLKWKLLHRVFSSALQVVATQAMFRAIGIGSSCSLPSAAALNWLLKDGLGRLTRCIYTASLGSAFDTNLKRVRFSTSILFSLSIGVELLTPAFPQYFLLLATIANIAKSISLAAYLATSPAIHRSFAIADNLGEVSAKSQIQNVCFDNLGLLLAAFLNIWCKTNQSFQAGLPFVIYPIFSAVELFAVYQGLKCVHLQTLTKNRLEIIIDTWICSGFVPSPAEVSNREGIDLLRKGSNLWPIRIGCADPKDSSPMVSFMTLRSLSGKDLYFICMELCYKSSAKKQPGILLSLREMAGASDIIMGILQACHIRKAMLQKSSNWDSITGGGITAGLLLAEWFGVVDDGKESAVRDICHLMDELPRAGWTVKNVLLNSKEQMCYSMVSNDLGQCYC